MDLRKLEPLWGTCNLQDILGVGSYGVVYRAVQTTDGTSRACAVKHISIPKDAYEHQAYIEQLGTRDDEVLKQVYTQEIQSFVDEFQVQKLFAGKAHFVQVEDILLVPKDDMPGNDLFIRMELLHSIFHRFTEGMSGSDTEKETLRVGRAICSALLEMHARNYLHRDIKPQNILVSDDGEYKLADFGSARRLSSGASFLSVKGTMDYIAPEILIGKMADFSSDLYSLGLVLYQLLNHYRLPFASASSLPGTGRGNIRRLSGETLPPPLEASPEMAAVILKACAFKPEDRFRDAGEMLQALKDIECSASGRSIGALMKQAWSCIRDGMDGDAQGLLAEVLTMDPQYAPAHAARACIALGFRNEEALSGASFRYEDQPDWKLAMHYADPDLRKIYERYVSRTDEKVDAQIHRYAHDCAVEMAVRPNLSRESLDAELSAYKKTCIWSAPDRADGSPRKDSQGNEDAFREAVMTKKAGRVSPQSLRTAAAMFESIGENDHSQECMALASQSVRRKTRRILISVLVILLAAGTLFLYLNRAGSTKGRTSSQGRNSASITVRPRPTLYSSSVPATILKSTAVSTATPTPEPTGTSMLKPTATPASEPTATLTPKLTETPTRKPTATPAPEPTDTPTPKPTTTPTPEPTDTPTPKPTATPTLRPTATPTPKPTATLTPAPTPNPTPTPNPEDLVAEGTALIDERKYAEALPLLELAASMGNAEAQYNVGNLYFWGYDMPRSYERALEYYHLAADQEYPEAITMVGYMYYYGYGVPQSYETGVRYYRHAAELGESNAMYNLGLAYHHGCGVPQSYATAIEHYKKAAEHGEFDALNTIGYMYEYGLGVKQSYKEALKYYREGADKGSSSALNSLGIMYENGKGVTQDLKKAVEYYQASADLGYHRGQYNLGVMYYYGKGIAQSYDLAARYWQMAANQGLPDAQFALGLLYYSSGQYDAALSLFGKAAAQGLPEAQFQVGVMYYNGNGVEKSVETALMYWEQAAAQGYEPAIYALSDP